MDTQSHEDETRYFKWCIEAGHAYAGKLFQARQGVPERHCYMRHIAEKFSRAARAPMRILEIGSWAGGSALTFGKALVAHAPPGSRVVCIDPWVPYQISEVADPDNFIHQEMHQALSSGAILQLFLHNMRVAGLTETVNMIRATSADILPTLKDESFDIIFIDGDHRYAAVTEDLRMCRPLVKRGGVLCGDDLEAQFSDVDQQHCIAMKANDYIWDDRVQRHFHPGVTLAVHDAFGRVAEARGFWAMQKRSDATFEPCSMLQEAVDMTIPEHFTRRPEFT